MTPALSVNKTLFALFARHYHHLQFVFFLIQLRAYGKEMSTLHHILFKEERLTLDLCFQWKFATKQKENSCGWDWNNFRASTRTNVQVGAVYVRPYEEILTRISRKSKLLRWEQENIATLWRGKTFYSVIVACPKLHRRFCVTFLSRAATLINYTK